MLLQFNSGENTTQSTDRKCQNCQYYKEYVYQYGDSENSAGYGECRRFPPRKVPTDENGFPLVEEDVWCGEFQEK